MKLCDRTATLLRFETGKYLKHRGRGGRRDQVRGDCLLLPSLRVLRDLCVSKQKLNSQIADARLYLSIGM